MSSPPLAVKGLRKAYGAAVAVDGIDITVEQGEIFGLLGPNGAGKTTTLECVEGIRKPDGGSVSVMGVDPGRDTRKLYNLIGVQLQTSGLPAAMKVDEAIEFFCAYHKVEPRYDLVDRLGLKEKRRSQFVSLSTGQQRRLALCLAVAHRPPLVLLDEPTAGLDVESRTRLHEVMKELQAEGTTIVLATHDMAEAEKMADRVSILLRGKVVASGTPRELTATGAGLTKISVRTEGTALQDQTVGFPGVTQRLEKEEYATFYSKDPGPTVAAILRYVEEQGDRLVDLRVERPTLEERFLEITQGGVA